MKSYYHSHLIFILCVYQVIIHDAATNNEIDKAVNFLSVFADEGQESFLSKVLKSEKALAKLPKLKEFYEKHCRSRCYSFQVNIYYVMPSINTYLTTKLRSGNVLIL